jgi:hypothetical protein
VVYRLSGAAMPYALVYVHDYDTTAMKSTVQNPPVTVGIDR